MFLLVVAIESANRIFYIDAPVDRFLASLIEKMRRPLASSGLPSSWMSTISFGFSVSSIVKYRRYAKDPNEGGMNLFHLRFRFECDRLWEGRFRRRTAPGDATPI